MKKFILLFTIGTALLFMSCEKFLDDPQPSQSLPSATAFTTVQDLETALVGAYNAFQHSDAGGTNFCMVPDIIADNGAWRGSFPSYRDIWSIMVTADNAEVTAMWVDGYRVINSANLVMDNIANVDDPALDQATKDRLRGEALFLRGVTLFEMVRFWGKPYGADNGASLGIPIMTSSVATTGDVVFPSRSSVADVYTQANSDLTEAATLLGDGEYAKGSKWGSKAYLAEIAFMKEDYPTAAALSSEVIASGNFALTAEPADFYLSEDNSEELFVVAHTSQDNPNVNGSLPTFHHRDGRGGDVVVDDDLLNNGYGKIVSDAQNTAITGMGFSVNDLRFTQLTSLSDDSLIVHIEKYEDPATHTDDAPLMRYAEVLLMRAEAAAHNSGLNQESVDLLNQVRTRALRVVDGAGATVANSDAMVSYSMGDFGTVDDLIEAIILERRVELTFEGNRFHDLMRLKRDVKGMSYDADLLRWPVPVTALDANSNLVQNNGY